MSYTPIGYCVACSRVTLALAVLLSGCLQSEGTRESATDPVAIKLDTPPTLVPPSDSASSKQPTTVSDPSPSGVAREQANQLAVASFPLATDSASKVIPPADPAAGVSEVRVRTPVKSKSTAGVSEITFDDIKFEMKEKEEVFRREMLSPGIEALVGKKVRLRGYILPSFQQRGLTQFVLMRDNMECCFGPGAWIYDCVIVEMKPGTSADFSVRPVAVEGEFSVQELFDADGKHLAVYQIVGENVK